MNPQGQLRPLHLVEGKAKEPCQALRTRCQGGQSEIYCFPFLKTVGTFTTQHSLSALSKQAHSANAYPPVAITAISKRAGGVRTVQEPHVYKYEGSGKKLKS